MDAARLKRLLAAGWKTGSVEELLRDIGADNRTRPARTPNRPGQKRVPTKTLGTDFALPATPRTKAKHKSADPAQSKRFAEEARKLAAAGVTGREFNRRSDVISATKVKPGPKSRSRKKRGKQ